MKCINKFLMNTLFCLGTLAPLLSTAQENIGMSSGNYAGVTSIWYNPANIADSRYKFDINLIGVNSYFNNNYLLVKNAALVRRLFYKDPYNSSFAAVKKDLLTEQWPVEGNVFARTESNIHLPLSFMATTGKRSAIALTMNNRTINRVDNLNPELARLFYNELSDPTLNGKNIRLDSTQYNFLNWQEVGFTYSRVMLSSNHHMLKLGVTLKWLGANAGGYIQTDRAVINFKSKDTMSLSSPLIHYARTDRADIGQFARKDLFNNLEDQSFGWDAGLVYEFRAKVKKFKYVDEDANEATRRDMNKYMFRIGLSVVDMGKFDLKKKSLTNDHSANILNWDFSSVKANNLSEFDTAYSKKVNYIAGAPNTFSYRLPAALIANFDLHLFGGFYVNLAAKAPFESFKTSTDTYVAANKWIAVTPRFESKFLGIYVPVIRANNKTNIGATIKFGPLYVGSNNLSVILANPSSTEADYHAGLRFSIPYGKPTKLSKILAGESLNSNKYATQQQVDSLHRELDKLKTQVIDSIGTKDVRVIINNNGTASTVEKYNDSVVVNNGISKEQMRSLESYDKQQATMTDSLVRQIAERNIEIERLKKENELNKSGNKKSKKESRNQPKEIKTSNDDLEREIERLNKQMRIQNAAIIGGGTAAVIATSSNKNDKKEAAVVKNDTIRKDSIIMQKADTVYIRDTVKLNGTNENEAAFSVVKDQNFKPILFANGSTVINAADKARIQQLANETTKHPNWRLEVTGMTDANGSVQTNRKMAAQRTSAVSSILLENGVKENQIIYRSKLSDTNNIPDKENPRRIEIRVLNKN